MAVITISRQFGAGGRTLGERLAKKLDYRYVNYEIIQEVSAKFNVSSDGVYAVEKAASSKLMRFLDKMVNMDYLEGYEGNEHPAGRSLLVNFFKLADNYSDKEKEIA